MTTYDLRTRDELLLPPHLSVKTYEVELGLPA
jgi:hypothetical protein